MTEPRLSRVVFGAMGLPMLPQAERTRLIHCAIDHGITSFDTAPLYGAGESERILGSALKDCRANVQILTKCGLRWDAAHGQPMFEMWVDGRLCTVRKDSRPVGIRQSLEESLRALATDVIDVYQVHQYDDRTPIEDVMAELDQARTAGKIRAIGVSNYPAPELLRAHRALPSGLFSTQSPFSLAQQETATSVLRAAKDQGLAFLAYEPLARGALAGKHIGKRAGSGGAPLGIERVNAALADVVAPAARELGFTLAQVALAWLLAQTGVTAAIAGASSEQQVVENAGAAHVQLEPALLERIDLAFAGCKLESAPAGRAERLRRRARRFKQAVRRRLTAWLS